MILKHVLYFPDTNSLEGTWTDVDGVNVKCRSYSDLQIDELVSDLGEDLYLYEAMIAEARSKITPPEPVVPVVPYSVSRFQARAAMAAAGIFDQVDTYMEALPKSNLQRLAWDDATDYTRDSATLNGMAAWLGLTEEQVDQLFLAASLIEG